MEKFSDILSATELMTVVLDRVQWMMQIIVETL